MISRVAFIAATTALLGASAVSASAQIIGVNFQGLDTNTLLSSDATGVVSASNWNNLTAHNGTAPALVDSTNTTTTLSLIYTSQYNVGGTPGTSTPFNNLYGSHLESPYVVADTDTFAQAISSNNRVTLSLTDIPYTTYNLYIYVGGNAGDIYQTSTVSTVINTAAKLSYTDANPGGQNFIAGDNYVEFTGLSGSTQYIYGGAPSAADAGGYNTAPTPEPSSYALLLVGITTLFFYCRLSARQG
jgi:hypothetical protein